MADERRYGEEEVAAIFEAAATPQDSPRRALSTDDGLTLAELQAIGREVGVAPERIADAAWALDLRRGMHPRRTDLSMPISVGRTIDLPRPLTDREWELLVAELRRTFNASGKVASHGDLREWTNGNLHAYVEPTEAGYRLRMGTLKGDAVPFNRLGIGGILMSLVLLAVLLVTGDLAEDLVAPVVFALLGGAALGVNALRLPRWADEREEQMDAIVRRVQALLAARPEAEAMDRGTREPSDA